MIEGNPNWLLGFCTYQSPQLNNKTTTITFHLKITKTKALVVWTLIVFNGLLHFIAWMYWKKRLEQVSTKYIYMYMCTYIYVYINIYLICICIYAYCWCWFRNPAIKKVMESVGSRLSEVKVSRTLQETCCTSQRICLPFEYILSNNGPLVYSPNEIVFLQQVPCMYIYTTYKSFKSYHPIMRLLSSCN